MNRVWKIIEERKQGSRYDQEHNYKGMSGMRMSGRKSGDSYEDGVKDGFCAAMDILEEHLKEFE